MNNYTSVRIAWVYPLSGLAFYLQPVIREFAKLFPESRLFTGEWPGYVPGCEETFSVEVIGKSRFITLSKNQRGYSRGIHLLSPAIVPALLNFNPDIIFSNGLSLWSLLVLLLKPLKRWKVILVYSGSSPNVDMSDSTLRTTVRRQMARQFDAAITNSSAGKDYLVKVLGFAEDSVFAHPYQMPDKQALLNPASTPDVFANNLAKPVFLFIGQVVGRKGISCLIDACSLLDSKGVKNFSVVVIGDGEQRVEMEELTQKRGLGDRIHWVGWVKYGGLGSYFENTDVFVFPTLEDIWGMVVLEAMLFGKPVLCSKWAGAKEMVIQGESGFIFNPYQPEELASYMQKFIQEPELAKKMGERSQEIIEPYNPQAIASNLSKIVSNLQKICPE